MANSLSLSDLIVNTTRQNYTAIGDAVIFKQPTASSTSDFDERRKLYSQEYNISYNPGQDDFIGPRQNTPLTKANNSGVPVGAKATLYNITDTALKVSEQERNRIELGEDLTGKKGVNLNIFTDKDYFNEQMKDNAFKESVLGKNLKFIENESKAYVASKDIKQKVVDKDGKEVEVQYTSGSLLGYAPQQTAVFGDLDFLKDFVKEHQAQDPDVVNKTLNAFILTKDIPQPDQIKQGLYSSGAEATLYENILTKKDFKPNNYDLIGNRELLTGTDFLDKSLSGINDKISAEDRYIGNYNADGKFYIKDNPGYALKTGDWASAVGSTVASFSDRMAGGAVGKVLNPISKGLETATSLIGGAAVGTVNNALLMTAYLNKGLTKVNPNDVANRANTRIPELTSSLSKNPELVQGYAKLLGGDPNDFTNLSSSAQAESLFGLELKNSFRVKRSLQNLSLEELNKTVTEQGQDFGKAAFQLFGGNPEDLNNLSNEEITQKIKSQIRKNPLPAGQTESGLSSEYGVYKLLQTNSALQQAFDPKNIFNEKKVSRDRVLQATQLFGQANNLDQASIQGGQELSVKGAIESASDILPTGYREAGKTIAGLTSSLPGGNLRLTIPEQAFGEKIGKITLNDAFVTAVDLGGQAAVAGKLGNALGKVGYQPKAMEKVWYASPEGKGIIGSNLVRGGNFAKQQGWNLYNQLPFLMVQGASVSGDKTPDEVGKLWLESALSIAGGNVLKDVSFAGTGARLRDTLVKNVKGIDRAQAVKLAGLSDTLDNVMNQPRAFAISNAAGMTLKSFLGDAATAYVAGKAIHGEDSKYSPTLTDAILEGLTGPFANVGEISNAFSPAFRSSKIYDLQNQIQNIKSKTTFAGNLKDIASQADNMVSESIGKSKTSAVSEFIGKIAKEQKTSPEMIQGKFVLEQGDMQAVENINPQLAHKLKTTMGDLSGDAQIFKLTSVLEEDSQNTNSQSSANKSKNDTEQSDSETLFAVVTGADGNQKVLTADEMLNKPDYISTLNYHNDNISALENFTLSDKFNDIYAKPPAGIQYAKLIKNGQEVFATKKEGEDVWVSLTDEPILTEEGDNIFAYSDKHRFITDAFKASIDSFMDTQVLSNQRQEYQRLLDIAPELVVSGFKNNALVGLSIDNGFVQPSTEALKQAGDSEQQAERLGGAKSLQWQLGDMITQVADSQGIKMDKNWLKDENKLVAIYSDPDVQQLTNYILGNELSDDGIIKLFKEAVETYKNNDVTKTIETPKPGNNTPQVNQESTISEPQVNQTFIEAEPNINQTETPNISLEEKSKRNEARGLIQARLKDLATQTNLNVKDIENSLKDNLAKRFQEAGVEYNTNRDGKFSFSDKANNLNAAQMNLLLQSVEAAINNNPTLRDKNLAGIVDISRTKLDTTQPIVQETQVETIPDATENLPETPTETPDQIPVPDIIPEVVEPTATPVQPTEEEVKQAVQKTVGRSIDKLTFSGVDKNLLKQGFEAIHNAFNIPLNSKADILANTVIGDRDLYTTLNDAKLKSHKVIELYGNTLGQINRKLNQLDGRFNVINKVNPVKPSKKVKKEVFQLLAFTGDFNPETGERPPLGQTWDVLTQKYVPIFDVVRKSVGDFSDVDAQAELNRGGIVTKFYNWVTPDSDAQFKVEAIYTKDISKPDNIIIRNEENYAPEVVDFLKSQIQKGEFDPKGQTLQEYQIRVDRDATIKVKGKEVSMKQYVMENADKFSSISREIAQDLRDNYIGLGKNLERLGLNVATANAFMPSAFKSEFRKLGSLEVLTGVESGYAYQTFREKMETGDYKQDIVEIAAQHMVNAQQRLTTSNILRNLQFSGSIISQKQRQTMLDSLLEIDQRLTSGGLPEDTQNKLLADRQEIVSKIGEPGVNDLTKEKAYFNDTLGGGEYYLNADLKRALFNGGLIQEQPNAKLTSFNVNQGVFEFVTARSRAIEQFFNSHPLLFLAGELGNTAVTSSLSQLSLLGENLFQTIGATTRFATGITIDLVTLNFKNGYTKALTTVFDNGYKKLLGKEVANQYGRTLDYIANLVGRGTLTDVLLDTISGSTPKGQSKFVNSINDFITGDFRKNTVYGVLTVQNNLVGKIHQNVGTVEVFYRALLLANKAGIDLANFDPTNKAHLDILAKAQTAYSQTTPVSGTDTTKSITYTSLAKLPVVGRTLVPALVGWQFAAFNSIRKQLKTIVTLGSDPKLKGLRYEEFVRTSLQFAITLGLFATVYAISSSQWDEEEGTAQGTNRKAELNSSMTFPIAVYRDEFGNLIPKDLARFLPEDPFTFIYQLTNLIQSATGDSNARPEVIRDFMNSYFGWLSEDNRPNSTSAFIGQTIRGTFIPRDVDNFASVLVGTQKKIDNSDFWTSVVQNTFGANTSAVLYNMTGIEAFNSPDRMYQLYNTDTRTNGGVPKQRDALGSIIMNLLPGGKENINPELMQANVDNSERQLGRQLANLDRKLGEGEIDQAEYDKEKAKIEKKIKDNNLNMDDVVASSSGSSGSSGGKGGKMIEGKNPKLFKVKKSKPTKIGKIEKPKKAKVKKPATSTDELKKSEVSSRGLPKAGSRLGSLGSGNRSSKVSLKYSVSNRGSKAKMSSTVKKGVIIKK